MDVRVLLSGGVAWRGLSLRVQLREVACWLGEVFGKGRVFQGLWPMVEQVVEEVERRLVGLLIWLVAA